MPEEHGDGVVETGEDALQHELVLARGSDDVERQVDRLLVQDELVFVEEDVACEWTKRAVVSLCAYARMREIP